MINRQPPSLLPPLADPLADWPNDDLLIRPESRAKLRRTRPVLLRVLDWPDLRSIFDYHDARANRGKRNSHCQGLFAVILAGLGIIILGLIPLFGSDHERTLAATALCIMGVGGLLGLLHWVILRSKSDWLGHRFWTERLRQLYFQSLINNLSLTSAAMTDDKALAELNSRRTVWLADFYTDPQDPRDRVNEIVGDRTEANTWLRLEWKQHQELAGPIEPLLEALYRQRIGIQISYAGKNLGSDIYAPATRTRLLHAISDMSTALVVIVALLGGAALLFHQQILGVTSQVWTAFAVVGSAVSLIARALDQGLQNEADADRYEWYAESLYELRERYNAAEAMARILELRKLEVLAYQELRRFLRTHKKARFVT